MWVIPIWEMKKMQYWETKELKKKCSQVRTELEEKEWSSYTHCVSVAIGTAVTTHALWILKEIAVMLELPFIQINTL